MKAIFIILICVACLIPILIGSSFGLGKIFNNYCTSDTDCARSKTCSSNKCISACDGVSCGSIGHCQTNNNHTSSCICGPKLKFDSSIRECVLHVITNSMKIYEFTLNNSRYVQFYFKGNANRVIVEFIFYIDESTLLFDMVITDKDIIATIGERVINGTLFPNTLSGHEYCGFWFRLNDSTVTFGTMESNTPLYGYPSIKSSMIDHINLFTEKETEWLIVGLTPKK